MSSLTNDDGAATPQAEPATATAQPAAGGRWLPLLPLLLLLLGLAAGYLATPRFHTPAAADAARLKTRALEYYRASRLLDYATMVRLFTPAQQLAQTADLKDKADKMRGQFDDLDPTTQEDLRYAAESINESRIQAEIDGNWALTSGEFSMQSKGTELPIPAEQLVWVKSAGDWWIFQLEYEPLNRYGNPPDKMRDLLLRADQRFDDKLVVQTADEAEGSAADGSADSPPVQAGDAGADPPPAAAGEAGK